ncbi:uncharacterized protein LOC130054659 isoform X2 [Ostrea edulis]|uniref:uncharacterized protein LOC130054659 isoform X2 n=1 Tax=Ostrea edulis TaxID=37623 RepID=UPI0024AFC072|nr:uncharacterized protein LOC130054659 isoform X2 [Ostrea edulis]
MEETHNITCSFSNSCRACSVFNISEPYFKSVVDLENHCSENYSYPFRPVTRIIFNGNEIESRNQTRCCEGSRILVYTIEESITDEAKTSSHSTLFPITVTQRLEANSSAIGSNPSATEITTTPAPVNITLLLSAAITGIAFLFVVALLCCIIVKCNQKQFEEHRILNTFSTIEHTAMELQNIQQLTKQ